MNKIELVISKITDAGELYNIMKTPDIEISNAAIKRIDQIIQGNESIYNVCTRFQMKACTPRTILKLLDGKSTWFRYWVLKENYRGYQPKNNAKPRKKIGTLRLFERRDIEAKKMLKNIISLFMKEEELGLWLVHKEGWIRDLAQIRYNDIQFIYKLREENEKN